MKSITLLLAILFSVNSFGQRKDNLDLLVDLGLITATYNNQYPPNIPPREVFEKLSALQIQDCQFAIDFIIETLKKPNDLMSDKYLKKPSKESLIQIYTINLANGFSNFFKGDQLKSTVNFNSRIYPSYYELVDTYYSMLFTAIIERNRAALYSRSNIDLDSLNLVDDTEKAIFFFRYLDIISGPVLIPIIINEEVSGNSCSGFNNFPTFNGEPFYHYNNFGFKDFPSRIVDMDGSYKHYFLDELFKIIFMYVKCREKDLLQSEEILTIVGNSILTNKELHRYCERKDVLDDILSKYLNY